MDELIGNLPTIEFVIFVATAMIAIATACMVVFQRNAMYSALFLVANFFCIAVLYLLLGAYFLAVVQIAVYAGAIMVLMLFVVMLLNVARPEPVGTRFAGLKLFGGTAAIVLLVQIALVAAQSSEFFPEPPAPVEGPHTQALAVVLFTRFLFPFEVTSVLLLSAIIGAVIIARKRGDVSLSRRKMDVIPSVGRSSSAPAAAEAELSKSEQEEVPIGES